MICYSFETTILLRFLNNIDTHESIRNSNAWIHTSNHAERTSLQRSLLPVKIVDGSTLLNGILKNVVNSAYLFSEFTVAVDTRLLLIFFISHQTPIIVLGVTHGLLFVCLSTLPSTLPSRTRASLLYFCFYELPSAIYRGFGLL